MPRAHWRLAASSLDDRKTAEKSERSSDSFLRTNAFDPELTSTLEHTPLEAGRWLPRTNSSLTMCDYWKGPFVRAIWFARRALIVVNSASRRFALSSVTIFAGSVAIFLSRSDAGRVL